ncbi:hypothetical protein PMAC_001903 [Pneumocystis sp. 'macacae']|nr:hypothetical protein PMAC_001903 [Pneumocystis sp. 'macacae']
MKDLKCASGLPYQESVRLGNIVPLLLTVCTDIQLYTRVYIRKTLYFGGIVDGRRKPKLYAHKIHESVSFDSIKCNNHFFLEFESSKSYFLTPRCRYHVKLVSDGIHVSFVTLCKNPPNRNSVK